MELRHLRHFIAVADKLSFSRAAQALHLTQPALSRQIRELEEELGCALFERRPNGVALTAEGRLLQSRAVPLLRDADDLTRTLQARGRNRTHTIRLAHFGTFIELHLVPFTHRLHQRHPAWRFELFELDPAEALPQLHQGKIDAAVMGRPTAARMQGLDAAVIWTEAPLLVLAADHRLAKRRRIKLADLAGERFAVWDEERFPGFGAPFIAACRAAGFEPDVRQTVTSVAESITAAARDGLIGYVGRLAGRLPAPGVVFKPVADGLDMPTLLLWRTDSPGAPVLRELAAKLEKCAPSAV